MFTKESARMVRNLANGGEDGIDGFADIPHMHRDEFDFCGMKFEFAKVVLASHLKDGNDL